MLNQSDSFTTPVKRGSSTDDISTGASTPNTSSSQGSSPGEVTVGDLFNSIRGYYLGLNMSPRPNVIAFGSNPASAEKPAKRSARKSVVRDSWLKICKQAKLLFPSISIEKAFVTNSEIRDFHAFKNIYFALIWLALSTSVKNREERDNAKALLQQLHTLPEFNSMCDQLMYENAGQTSRTKYLKSEWEDFYIRGIDEANYNILKKRQDFAFAGAQEIAKILKKVERFPGSAELSIEECHSLMEAFINSKNAKTPFFSAFEILAIQRNQTVDELRELLLDAYVKLPSPSIITEEMRELRFHLNYSETSNISSSTPGTNSITRITQNAAWNRLQAQCFDSTGLPTKYKLTDDDITLVLTIFDEQCHAASDINLLVPLFEKVFREMMSRFNAESYYATSIVWWSSSREKIPVDFKRYTDLLAPKDPEKPPYAFALFCYFLCQQGKLKALKHEKEFIQKYLVTLEDYRDDLNNITVDGKQLGGCVAPTVVDENSPMCPLDYIYDLLSAEVSKVQKNIRHVTPETIQQLKNIFIDRNGSVRLMQAKKDGHLLIHLIQGLAPVDHDMSKRSSQLKRRG